MANFFTLKPDVDFDSSFWSQDIGEETYTFDIRFNDRLELWILTIFDIDGEALASTPLLNEIPFLRLYDKTNLWNGDVMLTDDLNSKIPCGRNDLTVKYSLVITVE